MRLIRHFFSPQKSKTKSQKNDKIDLILLPKNQIEFRKIKKKIEFRFQNPFENPGEKSNRKSKNKKKIDFSKKNTKNRFGFRTPKIETKDRKKKHNQTNVFFLRK